MITSIGLISEGDFSASGCDVAAWDAWRRHLAALKATVPEARLRGAAQGLLQVVGEHWGKGVFALIELSELLAEKLRRDAYGPDRAYERLSEWLGDDWGPSGAYVPTPRECAELINNIRHCVDDNLSRPRFYDLVKPDRATSERKPDQATQMRFAFVTDTLTAKVITGWPCPCRHREMQPTDVVVDDHATRVVCGSCHRDVIVVERAP